MLPIPKTLKLPLLTKTENGYLSIRKEDDFNLKWLSIGWLGRFLCEVSFDIKRKKAQHEDKSFVKGFGPPVFHQFQTVSGFHGFCRRHGGGADHSQPDGLSAAGSA
jgi:hypothetical protein